MNFGKSKRNNVIFLVGIALLIIPQTRQPIQVLLHKGLAFFTPISINEAQEIQLKDYNWRLKDESESIFNFNDTKGNVVLVNFWATWCPPCIAEMPSLQKLYEDYGDTVTFVFVSNEPKDVIQEFLYTNEYTFNVFSSTSDHPDIFDVTSIPRTFLIDKEGYIRVDKTGAANWNSGSMRSIIDELLQ